LKDELLAARCRALKLVLTDVDGVMSDGTVWLFPDGGEARAFNVRDGLGIVLAHQAGLRTGLISGRRSEIITRRAGDLGMSVVRQGVSDKLACFREILAEQALAPPQVAYIGDDLNDLALLQEVGLSAAPADAPFEVRSAAFMVTETAGGRGCLREFIEAILRARGDWDGILLALGSPGI
jgi:3-deoxy-D-manno-octulosonate 8-phosphate phosphatase (KDO 8-P phosphatase)